MGNWNWAAMDSALGFLHRQYQAIAVLPCMLGALGYDLGELDE
jgi:hypothetical protein